ncbi:MAG: putative porin [Candidatus Omnitrophota bacterium]|nr:putative porin [Candidatus Omnitrophota bacterium]
MRRWKRSVLVGAVIAGCFPAAAWASAEVDLLLDKLVEKSVLTRQEVVELRGEMAECKDAGNKQLAKEIVPQWAQSLSMSGDLRFRHESFWRDNNPDRHRERARLRLGIKGAISEQLEAGVRLATGTNLDPVSTNQSAQDIFDKKDLFVDQAYLKFTTKGLGPWEVLPLTVWGGKFENPFTSTSLVWDGDLTPEGLAASLTPTWGPVGFFATGGLFPIDEINADAEDPLLLGSQAGLTWAVAKDASEEWLKHLKVKAALGYYDYKNLESTFDNSNSNFGNTRRPGNATLLYDFDEVDWLGELSTVVVGRPLTLWADAVKNSAVAKSDEGFQLGVKLGKADRPLAWETGYFWQRLEADAVVGQFTDSDFGEGGTNRDGHVFHATLGTLKNSTLGFKWFITEAISGPDNSIDRLQVDWLTKF